MTTSPGPQRNIAVDTAPPHVQEAFARISAAQADGAEAVGDIVAQTRRYMLDDGALSFFPEIGTQMSAKTIMALVLAGSGILALIVGIIFAADDVDWGGYVALAGGAGLAIALYSFLNAAFEDEGRRADIETDGLYLLPDTLVLRKGARCSVVPKAAITEVAGSRRTAAGRLRHLDVRYRTADGTAAALPVTAGRFDPLRALLQDWLGA